jgi:hypothetical protein
MQFSVLHSFPLEASLSVLCAADAGGAVYSFVAAEIKFNFAFLPLEGRKAQAEPSRARNNSLSQLIRRLKNEFQLHERKLFSLVGTRKFEQRANFASVSRKSCRRLENSPRKTRRGGNFSALTCFKMAS